MNDLPRRYAGVLFYRENNLGKVGFVIKYLIYYFRCNI